MSVSRPLTMRAYRFIFLIFSLAGSESVRFPTLPTYFIVDGAPSTLTAMLSEIQQGTVEWVRDGRPFASVDVDLDETGNQTLSNAHLSKFFDTKFEAEGGNLTTSVTISRLAMQFNGTTLALSVGPKKSSLSTIVFPQISYKAVVNIGNESNDNIDIEISIVIIGDFGNTSPKILGNLKDYAKTKGTRRIVIKSGSVGRIQKVKIGHRGKEDEATWYLRYILVEDPRSGLTYGFPVNGMMSTLDNGEIYPGVTQATNTSVGDCDHPPVGHPDFGIVGQNTTVTRNCTSAQGKNQTCDATWGCYEMGNCTLLGLKCTCRDLPCGVGCRIDPSSMFNIVFTCLALTLIKVFTEEII